MFVNSNVICNRKKTTTILFLAKEARSNMVFLCLWLFTRKTLTQIKLYLLVLNSVHKRKF